MPNSFGEYLKTVREDRNLTQREVEKRTGITEAYISQIENGRIPSIKIMMRFGAVYNLNFMEFVVMATPILRKELDAEKKTEVWRSAGS